MFFDSRSGPHPARTTQSLRYERQARRIHVSDGHGEPGMGFKQGGDLHRGHNPPSPIRTG
jgi:hypothetical protein